MSETELERMERLKKENAEVLYNAAALICANDNLAAGIMRESMGAPDDDAARSGVYVVVLLLRHMGAILSDGELMLAPKHFDA